MPSEKESVTPEELVKWKSDLEEVGEELQAWAEASTELRKTGYPVKIIRRTGASAVVEFLDGDMPMRVVIPKDAIEDGHVPVDVIRAGTPQGDDFGLLVQIAVDLDSYNRELRRAGIWTVADMSKKPNLAAMILNKVSPKVNLLIQASVSKED